MIAKLIAKLFLKAPWLEAIPWRVAGIVAAAGGLLYFGWLINGWRHDAALLESERVSHEAYQLQVEARDKAAREQQAADQAAAAKVSADLTALRADAQKLREAAARAPLTTQVEVKPNAKGRCMVPVRSESYRVCRNAAWTGSAADLAACEASGGDATRPISVPAAGLVQPRQP